MGALGRKQRLGTVVGVAVIAVGLIGAGCSSGDEQPAADEAQDGPAMLVVDSRDYEVLGAFDLADQQPRVELSLTLFAPPDADGSFAEGDLGLWTSPDPAAVGATATEGDPRTRVTVRNRLEALVETGAGNSGAQAVSWTERPDLGVSLVSTSLSPEHMQAATEAVVLDADTGAVSLAQPPGGLEEVRSVTGDQITSDLWSVWVPAGATDTLAVRYVPVEPGPETVDVITFTVGDESAVDDLLAHFRYLRPQAASTQVGDRDVWLAESDGFAMAMWSESETTVALASMDSSGQPPSDLIDDIRPATADERDTLLESSTDDTGDTGDTP
jgi:hypothetical protein